MSDRTPVPPYPRPGAGRAAPRAAHSRPRGTRHPGRRDVGDEDAYRQVLEDRAMHAKIALRSVLEGHPLDTEWTTSYLRERLAEASWTSDGTGVL